MSDYGTLESRVRRKSLLSKVMKPEDTIKLFTPGMNLAWSGFTPAGYPKAVPIALADHVEANNLQGKLKFNLFIGASVGAETEDRWATLDMIDRRWPYQTGKNIAAGINAGRIRMGDKHLGHFAQDVSYGFYTENGRYDIGIIEVSAITEDCGLALTTSCGIVAEMINLCDKIIIEVNTGQPSFEGIHDIHMQQKPPHRAPFLITEAHTRIGTPYVPCDPDKIVAIVESKHRDKGRAFAEMDDTSEAIAGHIMEFFAHEVKRGRLPENLLPLQSGVGSIANAVVGGLAKGPFHNLSVYTEVLQDTMLDFFDGGNLNFASACSLSLSESPGFPRFFDNWDKYFSKMHPAPPVDLQRPRADPPPGVHRHEHPGRVRHLRPRQLDPGRRHPHDQRSRRLRRLLRNGYLKIMHTPSTRPSKTDPAASPAWCRRRRTSTTPSTTSTCWSPSRVWPTCAASARATAPRSSSPNAHIRNTNRS
jgi:acetyl-CoA hydrolase